MDEKIDVRDAAAGILGEMLARLEELRSSGTDEAKKGIPTACAAGIRDVR